MSRSMQRANQGVVMKKEASKKTDRIVKKEEEKEVVTSGGKVKVRVFVRKDRAGMGANIINGNNPAAKTTSNQNCKDKPSSRT